MKTKHLIYCPFTGLGLYNGFRGNRWLRNRIQIFKQFVVPSLFNQVNQNYILWISWRPEERSNIIVIAFMQYLNSIFEEGQVVYTFSGVCFYDDKYPDDIARERLINSIHQSMPMLLNAIGECDYVLITIQPSDDIYERNAFERIQNRFENKPSIEALGYTSGYICNYLNKELAEYNPTTNPPFYTIKFTREVFQDPLKHINYTSLKKDVGPYKIGTPLPSHEYVGDCLNYKIMEGRGFLVGTHSENISTVFNHPFKGNEIHNYASQDSIINNLSKDLILQTFGIFNSFPLVIQSSFRKRILRMLPFKTQKKIRYILGEKIWNKFYNFLRS